MGVAAGVASGALATGSVKSFPAAFGSVPFHPAFPESCSETSATSRNSLPSVTGCQIKAVPNSRNN